MLRKNARTGTDGDIAAVATPLEGVSVWGQGIRDKDG